MSMGLSETLSLRRGLSRALNSVRQVPLVSAEDTISIRRVSSPHVRIPNLKIRGCCHLPPKPGGGNPLP